MSHLSFSDGNVTSQAALKVEASCKKIVNMNGLELVDNFLSHFACCKGGLVERASLPSWISYLWGPSKPGQGSGKHTASSSMICSSICRMWKTVWAWQTCACTVAALWSEPFHKNSQESLLFHSEVLEVENAIFQTTREAAMHLWIVQQFAVTPVVEWNWWS